MYVDAEARDLRAQRWRPRPALDRERRATLDVLSNGRFILGLGAGHTPVEWTMTGRDYPTPAERVGRFVETVDVVTRLLAGEVVTHHGRYVHVDDAFLLAPRPVQHDDSVVDRRQWHAGASARRPRQPTS